MFVCSAIIFLRVFIVIDYFDIYSFSREISKIVIILPGNTPLEVECNICNSMLTFYKDSGYLGGNIPMRTNHTKKYENN